MKKMNLISLEVLLIAAAAENNEYVGLWKDVADNDFWTEHGLSLGQVAEVAAGIDITGYNLIFSYEDGELEWQE